MFDDQDLDHIFDEINDQVNEESIFDDLQQEVYLLREMLLVMAGVVVDINHDTHCIIARQVMPPQSMTFH